MAPLFSCKPAASADKALPGPQTITSNRRTLLMKRIRSLLDLDDFGVICFLLSNEFYFLVSLRVRLDEASVQRAFCAARRLSNSTDCVLSYNSLCVVRGCIAEKS